MFAESEDISVTEDNIRKIFLKSYPEYKDCGFAYQEEMNLLFPILSKKSNEKPTKISLPVLVRAGGFQLNIEPGDIKGHSSATLDEIRKVLEGIYPEYSKERTEMIYDERHFIIPVLKSSRKGVQIQSIKPGWKHELYTDQYGEQWRKETTPFGIFSANLSQKGSTQFEFLIPKIPYYFKEKSTHNRRERPVCGHRGRSRGPFYYRITTFGKGPWDARDPHKTTFMALKHVIRLSIWQRQKETPGVEKAPGVSSPQRKESGRSGRDDGELRFGYDPAIHARRLRVYHRPRRLRMASRISIFFAARRFEPLNSMG